MAVNRTSKAKGKVVDLPNATVTIGTATDNATGTTINVAFTPSTSATGGPVFNYKAVSNPGSITALGTSSPITVTGLTQDTSYTFTVAANNASGTGVFSAASNSVAPTVPGSFESIATVSLASGATASSIDFSSIPSSYKHLQVRAIIRTNKPADSQMYTRFNGDTTNNYGYMVFNTNGTSAPSAGGYTPLNVGGWGNVGPNTGNTFFTFIMDILDYASTSKYKTTRILNGWDSNGSAGLIQLGAFPWISTSAISSISLFGANSAIMQGYTHVALYGLKG